MARRTPRILCLAALAASLAVPAAPAAPAGAEIYRWRDAQGNEHFTTDLNQVPPDQRDAAARGRPSRGGSITIHGGDAASAAQLESRRSSDSAAPRSGGTPAAADEIPAGRCARLQRAARDKQRDVRRKETTVSRWEDAAGDIDRSPYSRHRAERKLEEARASLEAARADYESFFQQARRDGVPPGCLR